MLVSQFKCATAYLSKVFLINDIEAIAKDAKNFRQAVTQRQPYKPLYIKIKVVWACNLRCGRCNHWRDEREDSLDVNFFKSLVGELNFLDWSILRTVLE